MAVSISAAQPSATASLTPTTQAVPWPEKASSTASISHRAASFSAATASPACPSRVAIMPISRRMAASTGSAVTAMQMAMAGRKLAGPPAGPGAPGTTASIHPPASSPSANGAATEASATRPSRRPSLRISAASRCRPVTNTYSSTPKLAAPSSSPSTGGVNTAAWRPGSRRPNRDGPSTTPATICTTASGATRRTAGRRHSSQGNSTMASDTARNATRVGITRRAAGRSGAARSPPRARAAAPNGRCRAAARSAGRGRSARCRRGR